MSIYPYAKKIKQQLRKSLKQIKKCKFEIAVETFGENKDCVNVFVALVSGEETVLSDFIHPTSIRFHEFQGSYIFNIDSAEYINAYGKTVLKDALNRVTQVITDYYPVFVFPHLTIGRSGQGYKVTGTINGRQCI